MRSNGSIAWDYLDGCVFVAHRRGRIVDSDFAEFLDDVLAASAVHRVVVRASDGAPRADHRATLQRWYMEKSVKGSVLTDSLIARGGVTALSWFGVKIRAFALDELNAALDYVEFGIERFREAHALMSTITARVDKAEPAARARGM